MMKRTMMAMAAVPAVLLAGGGVAVAQTSGAPAGTAVVQQAHAHHGGDYGQHQARANHVGTCDGTRQRDRLRDGTCDGTQQRDRLRDGTCDGTQQRDQSRDGTCDGS